MTTTIDNRITNTHVYRVKITLVSGLTMNYFETTFNLNQSEVAIKRAISRTKMKDVDSVKVDMIEQMGEI